MASKKNITAENIIELYMDEVLMEAHASKSVYAFSKKNNFEENQFYQFFSDFEALEKHIFAVFCTKTIELLLKNDDYKTYDTKSKLLSFYYTFFELLTANRSYVHLKLKGNKNKLESLKQLSSLRTAFIAFVSKEIHTDNMDFKNKTINKIQDKTVTEAAWLHLLFTLQFWLEDSSENFEKTDIFIEKSVKASFDLRDLTPLQSVFDFAKFLWKEKKPTV
ncbi:heat-shock protein [Polaribacter sp. SA4-10]|uniref:TetR family transcriptional regulator C-terminal domain-containing protein n=1 Tax=Polaribacter sp. SA4-10 TaxID=754397 RepID=UPI000B3CA663|nr:TetR family transcriptional regulator C-terminal domain-containing protein [Polaribacter sp. SA4-10]ARV05773.1 heat-shock protein [Polaribacter sp. SA4-10]